MHFEKIDSFPSFCHALREAGFSMGGSNDEGIFSLSTYFSDNLVSHTGNNETDPWKWRIRGVTECDDLLYGKFFFNKGGWITKEWLPYFMAVRRGKKSFDELYYEGLVNNTAKKVYDLISDTPNLSLQEIKIMGNFDKNQKYEFESALNTLQMKMFITISGEKFKLSKEGKPYGWPVTTFSKIEDFWGEGILDLSCTLKAEEAVDKIKTQILALNPDAESKLINKFIGVSKTA
ncbi:hypothetical protein IAI10_13440 [Clostridium sp. 19966]|uniref:AlkZ-related protein n=1 Tax=Clostridium sp. 19966 TaxID=2768166 RepID=UPI0028DE73AC|nr:hypothetical protein [Clostridium sp. 19966]MDT8717670.1 hypothetical protein [Clostridium sp. 19966]